MQICIYIIFSNASSLIVDLLQFMLIRGNALVETIEPYQHLKLLFCYVTFVVDFSTSVAEFSRKFLILYKNCRQTFCYGMLLNILAI